MVAEKVMQQHKVDLIFLDIQMPGMTGLQWLKTMKEKPMVILLTAYEQYALTGYEFDILDYLVKPVPFERFLKACHKAQDYQALKNKPQAAQTASSETADYFFVNADYSLVKIEYDDVLYVEGLKDYVKIFLKSSAKPILTRLNLKGIEAKLPTSQFMRVHKSFIVALKKIQSIRKHRIKIDTHEIPVSETLANDLYKMLGLPAGNDSIP
jgi:two-component system LytT family response regulator